MLDSFLREMSEDGVPKSQLKYAQINVSELLREGLNENVGHNLWTKFSHSGSSIFDSGNSTSTSTRRKDGLVLLQIWTIAFIGYH